MKKDESGDEEWLINYNENKIWAKMYLTRTFAFSPATVQLYFNEVSWIISDQVAIMKKGETIFFLRYLQSTREDKTITIYLVFFIINGIANLFKVGGK